MRGLAYVRFCAVVAALGGFLFGFDTAVISGTTDALKAEFGLGSTALGFTVASALIGTVIGAIAVGRPADLWGRRAVMFVLAILFLISAIGCAFAWSWASLVAFRIIGGLAVGGASVVSPMYIAEISPAERRGRLVAIAQFNIVLGIFLAFFSNYAVAQFGLGEATWRWMLGVEAVPAAAWFLLLWLTPRSPRWLLARGRELEARDVLDRLTAGTGESTELLVTRIKDALAAERAAAGAVFFRAAHAKPILLAVAIAVFNQLSGINAVLYYAPAIFRSAGAGGDAALLQSVVLGTVNLVFTMLALLVIDRIGRRPLMLLGSIGYIVSLCATAWAFYTQGTGTGDAQRFTAAGGWVVLASLVVFIASHAFGQGAVIWVFISEVFPNELRARGQALGTSTHWVMAALISQTFPMIAEWSGGHVFAFYAFCMVGQLVWVLMIMPETKGIPLEEIQRRLLSPGRPGDRVHS